MAARSCKAIRDDGLDGSDGMRWLDPNGGDTDDAFEGYCDFTLDGGGWTLVSSTYGDNASLDFYGPLGSDRCKLDQLGLVGMRWCYADLGQTEVRLNFYDVGAGNDSDRMIFTSANLVDRTRTEHAGGSGINWTIPADERPNWIVSGQGPASLVYHWQSRATNCFARVDGSWTGNSYVEICHGYSWGMVTGGRKYSDDAYGQLWVR